MSLRHSVGFVAMCLISQLVKLLCPVSIFSMYLTKSDALTPSKLKWSVRALSTSSAIPLWDCAPAVSAKSVKPLAHSPQPTPPIFRPC